MTTNGSLDFHRIHEDPLPIFMGELPPDYGLSPGPVVVNLCGVFPPAAPPVRTVLSLVLHDSLDLELLPSRGRFERFLDAVHLHAAHEASYWHCHAGINRAGFALAAYLHRFRGFRISDAIALLRERRSGMVLCNNVFEKVLRTWYGAADEQEFARFTLQTYLTELRRHQALARARAEQIGSSHD